MANVEGNIFDYRRAVRVTQPDGSIGVIHFVERGLGKCGGVAGKNNPQSYTTSAMSVVSKSLNVFAMLDAINELVQSLKGLRKKADEGDDSAMYDANMQISLISELRRQMETSGGRTRYNSSLDRFELY